MPEPFGGGRARRRLGGGIVRVRPAQPVHPRGDGATAAPEPTGGPRDTAILPRGQSGPEGPEPGEPGHWSPLPLRTPAPLDLEGGNPDLLVDRPISRRAMAYAWRHLRRPLPDGPPDVLDVEATIAQAERQGFLLAPVYRRRLRNHAHLVLLLDQNGSMAPFHRFTCDLLETAHDESTIRRVEAVYFHDLPTLHDRNTTPGVHLDPHLTRPGDWDTLAAGCSPETAALIVSDAGARGGTGTPSGSASRRGSSAGSGGSRRMSPGLTPCPPTVGRRRRPRPSPT